MLRVRHSTCTPRKKKEQEERTNQPCQHKPQTTNLAPVSQKRIPRTPPPTYPSLQTVPTVAPPMVRHNPSSRTGPTTHSRCRVHPTIWSVPAVPTRPNETRILYWVERPSSSNTAIVWHVSTRRCPRKVWPLVVRRGCWCIAWWWTSRSRREECSNERAMREAKREARESNA